MMAVSRKLKMTEQPEKLLGYNQNYIKRLPNILYT
jgi:hypothetical protein